jgi:hypothetical protein
MKGKEMRRQTKPRGWKRAVLFAAWSAKTQPLGKGDGFLRALGFTGKGKFERQAT